MDVVLIEIAKSSGPVVIIIILSILFIKNDIKQLKTDLTDNTKATQINTLALVKLETQFENVKDKMFVVQKLEKDVDEAFNQLRTITNVKRDL